MKLMFLGFGSIGKRHFANARLLLKDRSEDIQYIIVEPTRALWEKIENVEFRASLEGLDHCDICFICSPTRLHAEQLNTVIRFSDAVFIEKPLSHLYSGVDDLIRAAQARNCLVMVGCNYRFEKGLMRLKSELRLRCDRQTHICPSGVWILSPQVAASTRLPKVL